MNCKFAKETIFDPLNNVLYYTTIIVYTKVSGLIEKQ